MSGAVVHVASGREWRGGQRQVWLLARELARLGVPQLAVTGAGTELARRLAADGVPLRPVRWRAALDPRALVALLAARRQRPALLHAHDPHALALAAAAGVRSGIPLVVTRRVAFPLRRPGLWARADRVIAISAAVRAVLAAGGLDPARIAVVASAASPGEGTADALPVHARFGIEPSAPVAVSLAAFTPEKDHTTLLAAAALLARDLPALRWVLAGDGPLRDAVRRDVAALGLDRRVHLAGDLTDPEAILPGATLLVMSSTSEGLGTAALAAMARGVPVVATRVGGLAELLGDGAGLGIEPRDPAALARAVRRVVGEPALRAELADRGRAQARRHSPRGMAEQVLAVYRSCAPSAGRS